MTHMTKPDSAESLERELRDKAREERLTQFRVWDSRWPDDPSRALEHERRADLLERAAATIAEQREVLEALEWSNERD